MFLLFSAAVIYFSNEILSLKLPPPCEVTEPGCVQTSSNSALPHLFSGAPELGVESSDPLFIEEIIGQVSEFKYKFSNMTLTGGKNSYVLNPVVDKELKNPKYDMIFPKVIIVGKYEMSGKLLDKPLEGSGDFTVTTGKYIIHIDSEFEKYKGKDGKIHGGTKTFKLKCNAVEPIVYEFKNLFNGQKDLADATHKFMNENWLQVAQTVQDSVWTAIMNKLFKNFNKYLEYITLEDFFKNL